jgi:uncharacterized protein (TIGR02266 family)
MAASTKEKRRETRVSVDLWIEAERDGELYYQRASNLSVGGAFFAQTIPLPLGTRVALKFTLPTETVEVACQGEIVTAKDFGMGVAFVEMAADDRKRLEAIVEKLAALALTRAAAPTAPRP